MSLIIETSAIVAIIAREAEARAFLERIGDARHAVVPASCYLEAAMVLTRRKHGREGLERLIENYRVAFIPLDEAVARRAADAFARYGRGTGHPAALNLGDCIAYATAKHLDCPLLFKGDDFRHTDVKVAL